MNKSLWKYQTFTLKRISFILSVCVNYFFMCFTSLDSAFIVSHWPCFSSMSLRGALFTHARQLTQTSHIGTAEQCAKYWNANTCTPFMERSHTRIFWFYLAALLPVMRLSASQPHTQHFSYDFTYRLGKITPLYTMSAKSGVPSSWCGHRWLKDMSYKERVCVVEEETKKIRWGLIWLANVCVNWNLSCFMCRIFLPSLLDS